MEAGSFNGLTYQPGDTDLNGSVGGADFTTLAFNFGNTGLTNVDDNDNAYWDQGNFDGNGSSGIFLVGGSDFTALAFNFGFESVSAVPEPSGLPLLMFAACVIFGWTRKDR